MDDEVKAALDEMSRLGALRRLSETERERDDWKRIALEWERAHTAAEGRERLLGDKLAAAEAERDALREMLAQANEVIWRVEQLTSDAVDRQDEALAHHRARKE